MFKKMLILTVLIILTLSFTQSCDTTEPPEHKAESPREYTWQIDTLTIPDAFQNLMRSIWAANADDIYICGHNSGSDIYPGNGYMWHYDGKEWNVVDIYNSASWFGNLTSIHGSSSTNVWTVGYNDG